MDRSQTKCRLGIMRKASINGGGTGLNIFINGVLVASLSNGSSTRLLLDPGHHVIGFGIGNKISCKIDLDLKPDTDTNLVCQKVWTGVEAKFTPVDVCSLAVSSRSSQPQASGSGCLIAMIGIGLLLIGMLILGVRLKIFFFPIG